MTPAGGVGAAPRIAAAGRPEAAWALPFAPALTLGTELGDVFDQLADPVQLAGAGARRRGLRVRAEPGAELPLRALLDGWVRLVTGDAGDPPVLLLTADPPVPVRAWQKPPKAIAGPPAFVAYLGIDTDAAREQLENLVAGGFAAGNPRLALTRIGPRNLPLDGELARRYASDNRGAPARTATAEAREAWVRGLLQGLLDELRGGVWVAAGDDVGIAVEMADGRHWAEVCTFDAEGLPVDPRYYLRRLSGTKGLPARTAVPQARLEPLGLGGTAVPAFSVDADGGVRLPLDAGTAALRRDTAPFRLTLRGGPPDPKLKLSAPLTITEVAAPTPAQLATGWPITRLPAAGEDGLLAEAVRFYGLSGPPVTKPARWPAFDAAVIGPAIDRLRVHLHDRTVVLLNAVMADLGRKPAPTLVQEFNPAAYAARGGTVPQQLRGRLALRALVAPDGRLPAAVAQLQDRNRPARFPLRRFEDLDPTLTGLRTMLTRARAEAALRASFGAGIADPWGGTAAVARPGREASTAPGGGYAALGLDVGPSEKLYAELATTPFRAAHRASVATRAPLPATVAGGPPFTLHLDVATQVDVILREVLPNGAVPPEWQQWLIAIDTLEGRFLLACANPAAAAVGLPWGVVLACVLRAYVIELVGRTLTASLPVEQVHEEVDGYLGVALWEALTGQAGPQHPGPARLPGRHRRGPRAHRAVGMAGGRLHQRVVADGAGAPRRPPPS